MCQASVQVVQGLGSTWASQVAQMSQMVKNPPAMREHQASLTIINSRSLLKLMSIESVMPSNHLIFRSEEAHV